MLYNNDKDNLYERWQHFVWSLSKKAFVLYLIMYCIYTRRGILWKLIEISEMEFTLVASTINVLRWQRKNPYYSFEMQLWLKKFPSSQIYILIYYNLRRQLRRDQSVHIRSRTTRISKQLLCYFYFIVSKFDQICYNCYDYIICFSSTSSVKFHNKIAENQNFYMKLIYISYFQIIDCDDFDMWKISMHWSSWMCDVCSVLCAYVSESN